ncbi:NINE protein [Flavobacterium sp. 120]|jgi:TM2 domain-containing membrane protein YozV|uniref:NINE protein n=1 Tax=Flavobacterium sp. 120 TaxID=2135626 RepID=UPI000EAD97EB|nr:NINE protein [Flavobacterium sp. 120]RKS14306.1 putative oligomerization/nucleic acid binding protein [Flavobacterium sp. 120]
MKNKSTAAILAFFLGGIGVHRFYLGQGGLGILYLIFCWTFIPAIIAFVDFIIFLTMDEDKFNAKYNQGKVLSATRNVNTAEELEKLHGLMEKGIITGEEFQIKKAKLL